MPKIDLPLSPTLYPVPVALVSCGSKDRANITTIAWCGIVCSDPPQLSVSIRPSRHSHKIIKETGDFVVNIPTEDILKKADLCGVVSGRDKDKFKLCGFTKIASSKVNSPMIEECPVNIECKLKDIVSLGAHDMFIGEVVAVHAEKAMLDANGKIDYKKAKPIVYNQGEYWGLGRKIGHHGFSSK